MNKISTKSATELNQILSFLSDETKKKIPEDVWKQINEKTDKSISTKINAISDIKVENILPETRKYLSYIFLNYLATDEEKEEYIEIIKNNEAQYQKYLNKKYKTDNLFSKKSKAHDFEQNNIEKKTNLPVVRRKSIFQFVFDKIKRLFKK